MCILKEVFSTVSELSLLAMCVFKLVVVVMCVVSSMLVVVRVVLHSARCLDLSLVIPLGEVLRLLKLNVVPLC